MGALSDDPKPMSAVLDLAAPLPVPAPVAKTAAHGEAGDASAPSLASPATAVLAGARSEEHTSELQSH